MEILHKDKLYNKFKLTMDNKFRPRKLLVERNKSRVSKFLLTITRIVHAPYDFLTLFDPRTQNFRVESSTDYHTRTIFFRAKGTLSDIFRPIRKK